MNFTREVKDELTELERKNLCGVLPTRTAGDAPVNHICGVAVSRYRRLLISSAFVPHIHSVLCCLFSPSPCCPLLHLSVVFCLSVDVIKGREEMNRCRTGTCLRLHGDGCCPTRRTALWHSQRFLCSCVCAGPADRQDRGGCGGDAERSVG